MYERTFFCNDKEEVETNATKDYTKHVHTHAEEMVNQDIHELAVGEKPDKNEICFKIEVFHDGEKNQ